ncbi:hypothetical protein N9444_10130 [Gammaproteobacteria bacterium]|nr:hypothetical protein [Gammaproteobacteria bacterium]
MTFLQKYLLSNQTFASRKEATLSVVLLVLWWIVVLVGVNYHELYRDEVRALTIALEPESIFGLFSALKEEGHPVVWYMLLRFFHGIVDSPLVLPVVSTGVAFAGIFAFFHFAPFSNWQKILFIFGAFPIYQYSVMSRNYGLAMLLVFLFAHFYRTRQKNPLVLSILLFVLANTSAHACLITAVLSLVWVVEYFTGERKNLVLHLGSFVLVVLGGVLALVTTMPSSDTAVTSVVSSGLGFGELIDTLFKNLLHPAGYYSAIFPKISPLMRDLVFWGLFAGLCVKPIRAAGLVLGMILLGSFFSLVYYGGPRHQGIFYLLMITLYWVTVAEGGFTASFRESLHRWVVTVGLGGILALHFFLGGQAIWAEVEQEQSSVKKLAEYINQSSPDAILMPEPGYSIEAIPYYSNNEIYLIREMRYAKRAQFTLHANFDLRLDELLEQAQILEAKREKKVLIVLAHLDLASREKRQIVFPYGKKFSWTNQSLEKFLRLTEKVGDFRGAKYGENFEVYRLK